MAFGQPIYKEIIGGKIELIELLYLVFQVTFKTAIQNIALESFLLTEIPVYSVPTHLIMLDYIFNIADCLRHFNLISILSPLSPLYMSV